MGWAGFGKSKIAYGMFDLERNAEEAKRFDKCERIYHRGQELAWDGRDILAELVRKHGKPQLSDEHKQALGRVFNIILWGELAAWKISAQLADRLEPLEAKMAATSQAHDEARHFYVMYDYLKLIGYEPDKMDRAPQALLDVVLDTDNLAYKLLGMNLMIETLALTIFQTVRQLDVEPVLTELMTYYERDEARHVGLGMQYLPMVMRGMSKRRISALLVFQCRLLFWAMWENKVLEKDYAVLGIDPREILERGRRKQVAALGEAYAAVGLAFDKERNPAVMSLNAAAEVLFPTDETKGSRRKQLKAAWRAFWNRNEQVGAEEFDDHNRHTIKTARGTVAVGTSADEFLRAV